MGLKLAYSNNELPNLKELSARRRSKRTASPMNCGPLSLVDEHAAVFTELAMVSPNLARLLHRRAKDWLINEMDYRAAGFTDHDTND